MNIPLLFLSLVLIKSVANGIVMIREGELSGDYYTQEVTLYLKFDSYPSETSWTLSLIMYDDDNVPFKEI